MLLTTETTTGDGPDGVELTDTEIPQEHQGPRADSAEDAAALSLCRRVIGCLIEAGAIDEWWNNLTIYILSDEDPKLRSYDGITRFDGKDGTADQIGLRIKDDKGRHYKRAAIVGTLIHEMAHVLDGYHHNGKLAHSPTFYNHYSRLLLASANSMIFKLPRGMNARNHKALQRFDDVSPFSDVLDGCLLLDIEPTTPPPLQQERQGNSTIRVVLRHQKYAGAEKLAVIKTDVSLRDLQRVFKQKFPKHKKTNSYIYEVTTLDRMEQYILTEETLDELREGDTIYCSAAPQ